MSKKNSPVSDVPAIYRRKPPQISRRHPRMTDSGYEIPDPVPLAIDLVGLRPLTTAEMIARFDSGLIDTDLVPLDFQGFTPSDDDFGDFEDENPEDFATLYEDRAIAFTASHNAKLKAHRKAEKAAAKKAASDEKSLREAAKKLLATSLATPKAKAFPDES